MIRTETNARRLAQAEERYAKAADRFTNAHNGTWAQQVAAAEETNAWVALVALRFIPGVRVQTYMHGRPYRQATVVKLHEDNYVEVVVDGERGGTRIFANQVTLVG